MNDRAGNDPDEDPTRRFLEQTVPREDSWDGREPEEGPARPRHVQHPTASEPLPDPRERRKNAIKGAAWTFGPSLGYIAATSLFSSDSADAEPDPARQPAPQPEPEPEPEPSMYDDAGGYGEIGSGL